MTFSLFSERRGDASADGFGVRTAGLEWAARWRADERWGVSWEYDSGSLSLLYWIGDGGCGKERFGVGVKGSQDRIKWGKFDERAQVEDGNVIGQLFDR